MKKFILCLLIAGSLQAGKPNPMMSPTKSGHALRKASGAHKHERDQFFRDGQNNNQLRKKLRRAARAQFETVEERVHERSSKRQ